MAEEITTEVYRKSLWFSGVDAINFTGYSDTKGLKYIRFPESDISSTQVTPTNYGLSNDYKVTVESDIQYEVWFKWYKGSSLIDDWYTYCVNNQAVVSKTEIVSQDPGATLTLLNKK